MNQGRLRPADGLAFGSSATKVHNRVLRPLMATDRPQRTHRIPGCSDRTLCRLQDWADAGVGERVLRTAVAGYDQMIGLDLDGLSVDGSITTSACGGEVLRGTRLINRARTLHRWPTRPTTRRLR